MSILYRAIFTDDRPNLLVAGRRLFSEWLARKGFPGAVPVNDRVSDGNRTVSAMQTGDEHVTALRLRLDEEVLPERWSTTLLMMEAQGEQHVWVDVERVSEDVYGPPPLIAPPRLVQSFLAGGSCRAGPTVLRPEARVIDEEGIPDLVGELLDQDRTIPVVVASTDLRDPDAPMQRGTELARVLWGVASVWALQGAATNALSKALGPDLHVFGGAVRTYLPGFTLPDSRPWRHRFVSRDQFLPRPKRGAQIVGRSIVSQAVSTRPPLLYRERVKLLSGFAHRGDDRDLEALITELDAVKTERDGHAEDLFGAVFEAEDQARRAVDAERRVRWLEQRPAELGDRTVGLSTPEAEMPETAESCIEALELAEGHLPLVVIGDTLEAADELDRHIKARTWGRKAWEALRALQSYAEAKSSGVCKSNFFRFCEDQPAGSFVIPTEWAVPHESETTTNNRKYYDARFFSVPAAVDPSERAYMQEHIRIEKGSDPAPRLHYWDDTSGVTKKIYVGYLGRHLPSSKTN